MLMYILSQIFSVDKTLYLFISWFKMKTNIENGLKYDTICVGQYIVIFYWYKYQCKQMSIYILDQRFKQKDIIRIMQIYDFFCVII